MENTAMLVRRLNPYCARAMEGAASLCQTLGHAEIQPEHWLLKLLEQEDGDLAVLARRYEWDLEALWLEIQVWLDNLPHSFRCRPQLSDKMQSLLQEAWLLASQDGERQIRSIYLLMALVNRPGILRCDGLWPLLVLSQRRLEHLHPLLNALSDERSEVQCDEDLN